MTFRNAFMLSLGIGLASPQAGAMDARIEAAFGIEQGGDNLMNVRYANGDKQNIRAGDGWYVAIGGAVALDEDRATDLAATVGFKHQTIQEAENGDANLTRFPVELILSRAFERHRVGLGVTHHLSPELDGSGVLADFDLEMESQLGTVLRYDFQLIEGMVVGLKKTDLTYEIPEHNAEVDASSWGLYLSSRF